MSKFIFELNHITYSSSDVYLNDLNINLAPNEIHAIIVNSSSEQNTLIQALLQIGNNPEIGSVCYKGEQLTVNPFYKKHIAILHQKPLLVNDLTVAENLHLPNLPKRRFLPVVNWKKVRMESKNILKYLDFNIAYYTKVENLSDEQKRLVYIAKAFLGKPSVIVMQEPMEGLSSLNAAKLQKNINQFKDDGGSILYITKQWEETLRLADRISILSKGKITEEMSADAAKMDTQKLIAALDEYNFSKSTVQDKETQDILDAVFSAAEHLTSEYELKDVLLILAKEVANFMNADGCSIKLIDEPTWTIIDDFEYKKKGSTYIQLTKNAIIKIAEENDIFYTNKRDHEFYSLFNKVENIQTLICVPVLIRSQVTGIIQIYYENLYVYSKEESKYLSTLARHAAIAIEDTRLMGRSALLQESHHRIKNNLQSIVGIISLQKAYLHKNPLASSEEALDNIISRVKSIASVHNLLSKEKLGRSIINVKTIIEEIVAIMNFDKNVTIQLELEDIFIPYNKATSIALVVNELANNSLKHAFPGNKGGEIYVKCKRVDDIIYLTVHDNGIGLPRNFDISKSDSLGLTIIQGIVISEFQGEINFYSDAGTTVEIKIDTKNVFLN